MPGYFKNRKISQGVLMYSRKVRLTVGLTICAAGLVIMVCQLFS
jgi:hypothetical protein